MFYNEIMATNCPTNSCISLGYLLREINAVGVCADRFNSFDETTWTRSLGSLVPPRPSDAAFDDAKKYTACEFQTIGPSTWAQELEETKAAIMQYGVVMVEFLEADGWYLRSGGTSPMSSKSFDVPLLKNAQCTAQSTKSAESIESVAGYPIVGAHAALLVGWNDTPVDGSTSGAFILMNSWGSTWGDGKGFGKITYDYLGLFAMDTFVIVSQTYNPL